MDQVEIKHAHVWVCPSCGRENFCHGVTVELTAEERAEMVEDGIPPESAVTGEWMTAPSVVTCQTCELEYLTDDTSQIVYNSVSDIPDDDDDEVYRDDDGDDAEADGHHP